MGTGFTKRGEKRRKEEKEKKRALLVVLCNSKLSWRALRNGRHVVGRNAGVVGRNLRGWGQTSVLLEFAVDKDLQ